MKSTGSLKSGLSNLSERSEKYGTVKGGVSGKTKGEGGSVGTDEGQGERLCSVNEGRTSDSRSQTGVERRLRETIMVVCV